MLHAIAGVFRHHGDARRDRELVGAMLARSGVSAARRVIVTDGPVCTGASMEAAPQWSIDRQLLLAWNGRLDNPRDFDSSERTGDVERVATALAAEPARVRDLLGDFALAAWRPGDRRLLLARDAMGIRPLFFAALDDVCWWASSLTALLVPEWLPRTINEGYVAEYLMDAAVSLNETVIRGAFRVEQGQVVEIRHGTITRRRYWTVDHEVPPPPTASAAIEELSSLLRTAVAARLPSSGRVAFQLSGGLDSSAVVGLARTLGVAMPETYSMVYPRIPEADETPFIDAVVAYHGCRSTRVPVDLGPVLGYDVYRPAVLAGELPEIATGEFICAPYLRRTAEDGHTVMLTGFGGDSWLTGTHYAVSDLIRRGHWASAWRHARDCQSLGWVDPSLLAIVRAVGVPLLPEGAKRLLRSLRPALTVPWMRPEFASRVDLPVRMRGAWARVPRMRSLALRDSLMRVTAGDPAHARDAQNRAGRNAGLELRHPFYDRRVVEFLVRLPDEWRLRGVEHRWILRRAMGDLLPPMVAARPCKPILDQVVVEGLMALDVEARLHEPLEVVSRGWVNPTALWDMWARAPVDCGASMALWRVLGTEAVIRALSSRDAYVPEV